MGKQDSTVIKMLLEQRMLKGPRLIPRTYISRYYNAFIGQIFQNRRFATLGRTKCSKNTVDGKRPRIALKLKNNIIVNLFYQAYSIVDLFRTYF